MIDVILVLAAIIGLTIVGVRYGRRLLALGGMVLAWAFEGADTEPGFEEEWRRRNKVEYDDPANAPVPGNASYHVYEEFSRDLHSETG